MARRAARLLIRGYQLSFSALVGRQCRHLPSCSDYADEAIARHGLWFAAWMTTARVCRCQPFGTSGLDPVPPALDAAVCWYTPWRAAYWRHCCPMPAPSSAAPSGPSEQASPLARSVKDG